MGRAFHFLPECSTLTDRFLFRQVNCRKWPRKPPPGVRESEQDAFEESDARMNFMIVFLSRVALLAAGLFVSIIPAIAVAQPAAAPPAEPRRSYNFNPDWKLLIGDPKGAEA